MSTESKRSRMRNRKIPITISATRIEKATLISTTSGMPLAPVAARMRPFSIDMKPITWPTALRRDTIISSNGQHDQDRQRHQPDSPHHDLPNADHGLDVGGAAQPHDDAVKNYRD